MNTFHGKRDSGDPVLDAAEISKRLLEFEARFGRGGIIDTWFAPGRINLIGEHTDYNGGKVLPIALDRGNYLLVRRSELPPARLYSTNVDLDARIYPADLRKKNDWADYVRGVYQFARVRCPEIPPFDALYFGDLPLDSGLSSSASIEVVTAMGFESLGCRLSKSDIIKIGRRAENDFVGVYSGIMDQFVVAMAEKGHALLLDCATMEYRHIPYNVRDAALIIGHTGVRRSLADTPYNDRRHECAEALKIVCERLGGRRHLAEVSVQDFEQVRYALGEKLAKRTEHVIFENLRVEEAARCLERGDSVTLGHLMNRSHESLRDLFNVSSLELDAMQELFVSQPGVYGCRMTGAGFGGCVVALVKPEYVERYIKRMPSLYWQSTHCDGEFIAAAVGPGAHRV